MTLVIERRLLLQKRARCKLHIGLSDFVLRSHDDRSSPSNRLIQSNTTEQNKRETSRARQKRNIARRRVARVQKQRVMQLHVLIQHLASASVHVHDGIVRCGGYALHAAFFARRS